MTVKYFFRTTSRESIRRNIDRMIACFSVGFTKMVASKACSFTMYSVTNSNSGRV